MGAIDDDAVRQPRQVIELAFVGRLGTAKRFTSDILVPRRPWRVRYDHEEAALVDPRRSLCFAAILGGRAGAVEVYPGCPVPPTTFNHIWYIDPVNGKTAAAGGLGTQAAPWNSLQAAFSVQPGYTTPLLSTAPYRHPNPANPADTVYPAGARSNPAMRSCS